MKSNLLALLFLFIATAASASDYKLGALEISQPWSRATPNGAKVAAGYLKITNAGTSSDRLIAVSSPVAGHAVVHEMAMTDGIMTMRPLKDGLEIKAGETVELKPGSLHIMMMDLKEPLIAGQHVKATLTFEKAGSVDIEYGVESIGGKPKSAAKDKPAEHPEPMDHSGHMQH